MECSWPRDWIKKKIKNKHTVPKYSLIWASVAEVEMLAEVAKKEVRAGNN